MTGLRLALTCALVLCAPAWADTPRPTVYRLDVWFSHNDCRVAVDGHNISPKHLLKRMKKLPDKSAEIHVHAAVNTPYRCIGGAIYSAQSAGFQMVGFISADTRE